MDGTWSALRFRPANNEYSADAGLFWSGMDEQPVVHARAASVRMAGP